ncbi:hypothetical protein ES708_03020 [subsurface metagenome]
MRAISIILSTIAILLIGLFTGYLLWGPTWEIPQAFKYDVLKDTLIIVLTFAAVAIAVLGAAVYRIVHLTLERERETFERETGQRIIMESRRWRARLAINVGYNLWKMGDLKEAILWTKEAHDVHAHELDERELENELLLGQIRNNLASYFAQAKEERDLARGYATYIHNIRHKFPTERETWEKTYKEVFEAFPDQ